MGLNFIQDGELVDHTPSSAVTAGDPVRLSDGRVGVAVRDIAANKLDAVRVKGIFEGPANSADTWNKGDTLVWDASTGKLVKKALTLDGSADLVIGPAQAAKTNGQTTARAALNEGARNDGLQIQAVVYEFDVETLIDPDPHVLIPAAQNPYGLLLLAAYGIVTEQMAGSSQDQGIVTIEDTDGTDLCTLTPSDAAADAVGDVIVGTSDLFGAATGDAAKVVPAGKGVRGVVTQATAGGTPAGKYKVYLLFLPLL